MEYLIIFALQVIGIGLHVAQKINQFDKANPDYSIKQVIAIFWEEDWNTLLVSGLVLALTLIGVFIVEDYTMLLDNNEFAIVYLFGASLVLGYSGQRLIYKYLGTAENYLNKKVEDKLQ